MVTCRVIITDPSPAALVLMETLTKDVDVQSLIVLTGGI
jgi:hypothetical protein